jgi:hypothetical protein
MNVLLGSKSVIHKDSVIKPQEVLSIDVTGTVDWRSNGLNSAMQVNMRRDETNPYLFFAQLNTVQSGGSPNMLTPRAWNSIKNVIISYQYRGNTYPLPGLDVSPAIPMNLGERAVTIDGTGTFTDKVATIAFKPSGPVTPYRITKLLMSRTDEGTTITVSPATVVSDETPLVSGGGPMTVQTFSSRSNFTEGQWQVTAEGYFEIPGTPTFLIRSSPVFLKEAKKLMLLQPNQDLSFPVEGQSEHQFDVATNSQLTKQLKLRFYPDSLDKIATIASTENGMGRYTFKFTNLNKLPYGTTAYFTVADENGNLLSERVHKIAVLAPALTNFGVDISKDSVTSILFSLPSWIQKQQIALKLTDLGVTLDGNNIQQVASNGNGKTTSYKCEFRGTQLRNLFDGVKSGNITSTKIAILLSGREVQSLEMRCIDREMLNRKVDELIKISASEVKKKERSDKKDKITQTLTDIYKIINNVTALPNDSEVAEIVEKLTNADNKNDIQGAMKAISSVGKWVTALGPTVIPLIAAL